MAVQIFKTKQLAVDLDANRQKRIEEMIKCSLVILGCREDEHSRCPHDLFSSSSGGGASGPSRGVPCSYGWHSLQLQQPPWEASDPSGRPEPDTVGWQRTACAERGRGRDRRAETAGEGRCHGDRQDVPVLRQHCHDPCRTVRMKARTVCHSSASAGDTRVARVHASAILVPRAACRASPPTNLVPRILIHDESARSPSPSPFRPAPNPSSRSPPPLAPARAPCRRRFAALGEPLADSSREQLPLPLHL